MQIEDRKLFNVTVENAATDELSAVAEAMCEITAECIPLQRLATEAYHKILVAIYKRSRDKDDTPEQCAAELAVIAMLLAQSQALGFIAGNAYAQTAALGMMGGGTLEQSTN